MGVAERKKPSDVGQRAPLQYGAGRPFLIALHRAACFGGNAIAGIMHAKVECAGVRDRVRAAEFGVAAGARRDAAPRLVAGRAVLLIFRGDRCVAIGSGAELVRTPDCVVEAA